MIRRYLNTPDIIVLHGARQVGKTSILKMLQAELSQSGKAASFIDLEDLRMLELLDRGADALLAYLDETGQLKRGKLFLLVDEIQYLKNPSNILKLLRDHHADKIKLIVSGSSSFDIKSKFKDSLAGRTVNFEIMPLSFREFLRFREMDVDLDHPITAAPLIEKLKLLFQEFALYGGYPRVVLEKEIEARTTYLSQVIAAYIHKDIRDLANIRDVEKFNKLLVTLASQCSQMMNVSELANTVRLSRSTVEQYLFLLESTYVIRLVRPFSGNIRSELFKMPKIFFLDTGVAQLLWLKTFQQTLLGNVLENAVYCELFKNHPQAEIRYWRTQDGKEIDFILRQGQDLLPVETKVSGHRLNLTAMHYFRNHYHPKKSYCMALEHDATRRDETTFKYPWELICEPKK